MARFEARENMLHNLGKLVALQTVSEQRNAHHIRQTDEALRYVTREAQRAGNFNIKEIDRNGYKSLIIGTEDTLTPDIGLSAHIDVAPAPDNLFKMDMQGDTVTGRGTADMKFALAVYLETLKDLPQGKDAPSVSLLVTSDEEIGSKNGAQYLAEEVGYRPSLLFVPDGGPGWQLVQKAKGSLHVRVEKEGKQSHAARPWEGSNAIMPVIRYTAALDRVFPEVTFPDWYATTMNVSLMQGGKSINSVAPDGMIHFDFRYPSLEERERVVREVTTRLPEGVKLTFPAEAYVFSVDPKHPKIKLFTDLIENCSGQKVTTLNEYGATDARFFNQYGVPSIVLMPPGGGVHKDDEWLSVPGMVQYYEALRTFINHDNLRKVK